MRSILRTLVSGAAFVFGVVLLTLVSQTSNTAQGVMLSLNPTVDLDVNSAGSKSDDGFLDINGNNSGSNQRRALLQFDLSDPQLIGATINSATLTFNQIELGTTLDQHGNASLRRIVTQPWSGSTLGTTLFAIAKDAGAVGIGSFSISPPTNPPAGLYNIDISSTVQGWIDNSFANYGLSISATEGAFTGVERRFDSSTGTIAPVLLLDFTLAPPVPEPASGFLLALGSLALVRLNRRSKTNRRS